MIAMTKSVFFFFSAKRISDANNKISLQFHISKYSFVGWQAAFYFQFVGKLCGRQFGSFIEATLQKSQRDVKLLHFFRNKNEHRKVEQIPAEELNK